MQTGVLYPTFELAGITYELRIDREILLYRLSRKGVTLGDLRGPKSYATLHDVLYAIIQDRFIGSAEDLVRLIASENKYLQMDQALAEVVKKVFPPPQAQAAATEPAPAIQ